MSERRHIGRYEIVGELATGGMAEILLARMSGPNGFVRAVAIKRILPGFANEQSFVDMFVDEARIAARINHANVVHYEELGQDDGQLYLVMEYLEGESTQSLLRRALARRHALTAEECMYIVAEAAGGLNAAHEMTDLDGSPLDIVHRDISPQNIFITYRGEVKVMDFGIAKAADRITVTEAGSLKGKFAYMSPEQAEGEMLDRRSDVFSLGIVLYELTTGRRLFRRATQVATLRAVREGQVVPPSAYLEDYAPELERICMKALALERSDRYSTAEELRRDLLLALREAAPATLPEDMLRSTLSTLFHDRIDEKKELLRRVSSGSDVSHVPSGDVDGSVELPIVDVRLVPTMASTRIAAPPVRKTSRAKAAFATAVILAAGVAAFMVSSSTDQESSGDPEEPAAQVDAPELALPTVIVPHARSIEVRTEQSATVFVSGEAAGETPLSLEVPLDAPLPIELRRQGAEPLEVLLSAEDGAVQLFRLSSPANTDPSGRMTERTRTRTRVRESAAPAAMETTMAFPRF